MKKTISLLLAVLFAFSCFSVCAFAQTQQPCIVETIYPTEDVVIADVILTEAPYNADNTGTQDVTAILNNAIADVYATKFCPLFTC